MKSGNMFERLWKLQASANQLVLEGKREPEILAELLQKFVFGNAVPDINWLETYKALGKLSEYAEFANSHDIKAAPDFWVVPVINGVTCNKVVGVLRQLGVEVYLYTDELDKMVPANDRDPSKGSYAIGFRRTVEADEENKKKSANALAKESHKGITLLERLLLELGYFLATGNHLDTSNTTLCAGSRCSDGNVPGVVWSVVDRGVYVRCYSPDYACGVLRSRSAVSLADKTSPSQP